MGDMSAASRALYVLALMCTLIALFNDVGTLLWVAFLTLGLGWAADATGERDLARTRARSLDYATKAS
jgi:cell division protein FtsW (lipid II flippase)